MGQTHVWRIEDNIYGTGSLYLFIPLCGFQEWNLGHQACITEQEAPWPTEPPWGPLMTYPLCICTPMWHCQASSVLGWHYWHVQLSLKPWPIWLRSLGIRRMRKLQRFSKASSWPNQKAHHIQESKHTYTEWQRQQAASSGFSLMKQEGPNQDPNVGVP